jgi:hypothetical protein
MGWMALSRLGIGLDLLPTILFTEAWENPSFLSITGRGNSPRVMYTFAIAIALVILACIAWMGLGWLI